MWVVVFCMFIVPKFVLQSKVYVNKTKFVLSNIILCTTMYYETMIVLSKTKFMSIKQWLMWVVVFCMFIVPKFVLQSKVYVNKTKFILSYIVLL